MRTIYVEKMGTGVLRINRALREAGLPEAEFHFDDFSFSITLHSGVASSDGGVNGGVNELLSFISEHPGKRSGELCKSFNTPRRTVERRLKELKGRGIIEFRGAPKTGGYYAVTKRNIGDEPQTKIQERRTKH